MPLRRQDSALSGKQISYLREVLRRPGKRERALALGTFRTAKLSDLKSNKKSRKGSPGPATRNSLSRPSSLRMSAASLRRWGVRSERWKKKRELIPVNCSELKFAESALSN